jgi:hypothetical protein
MAKLAVHAQALQQVLAVLPVNSEIAKDIGEALNKLRKHIPPGAVSQGVQMSEAQKALFQARQQQPIAAMRGGAPGGGPPGGGGPPPMAG